MVLQGRPKKGNRASAVNKADIVFCIDISGSMTPCIEGVKDNIQDFIDGLDSPNNVDGDYRIGFIAQDSRKFEIFKLSDYENYSDEFKNSLKSLSTGADEFTLPALDWAADFDWDAENKRHSCIVLFTDEPIDGFLWGGYKPKFQKSKVDLLIQKLKDLKILLYMVTPRCKTYEKISKKVPKSSWDVLNNKKFSSISYSDLLVKIGKTLSASMGNYQKPKSVTKDLYDVQQYVNIKYLN